MDLTPYINLLPAHYAALAVALVGLCAAVSAFLPPPAKPGTVYAAVYRAMNFIGANFGHATNATAPVDPPAAPGAKALGFLLPLGLAATVGLAACAGLVLTPASVARDVALVDEGLQTVLRETGVVLPPAVQTALADLDAVAKALSASETVAEAKPLVQRVGADVDAVAAASANLVPAGSNAAHAIEAARVLVPAIESAVGIVAPASATPGQETAATARLVLAAAASR